MLFNKKFVPKKIEKPGYITDVLNKNNFGVLFHTMDSIEQFQDNSGMSGNYSKEYQHHYWAAVSRVEANGQILDIAIPLVLFNYYQEIGGADIEFSLPEVHVASDSQMELVDKKFEELANTDFFKQLEEEYGFDTWQKVPLNSIHVHPGTTGPTTSEWKDCD